MKPVISEKIQMDSDGQITIPNSILDLYGIHDAIDIEIQLLPNGTIKLIPKLPFPKSFYMESSQDILEGAAKGYRDSVDKKYVSEQEIKDLLKEWIILKNTIDIPLKFFTIATKDL